MTGGGFVGLLMTCACLALAACGEDPRATAPPPPVQHESKGVASVLLVIDSSAEMSGERLDRARAGLDALVRAIPASERVGLARFGARFEPLVPVTEMRGNRAALRRAIAALRPGAGAAAPYDAVLQAYGIQRELSGGRALNAVIVVAHAEDSASDASYRRVRRTLGSQSGGPRLRVMTIAYDTATGSGLREALAAFARASGGDALRAAPEDVEAKLRAAWEAL